MFFAKQYVLNGDIVTLLLFLPYEKPITVY